LHWFNPLIWFAFHRMRTDREMACDALVLTYTGERESQEYGRAIVALLQRLSRSRPLPAMAATDVRAVLLTQAERRWRPKVLFARRRVERLGWSEACHHAALEILGYRFNRVPMLRVAVRAPLAEWANGAIDLAALMFAEASAWSLQGVRPANHPRVRLGQYAAWTRAGPAWPERLARLAGGLPAVPAEGNDWPTTTVRRRLGLTALRARIAQEITSEAVGGTRFDNLMCDGFLPLLSARTERNLFPFWFHWFAGDLPPRLTTVLRSLGVFHGRPQPACHGPAQGLLGWMLAREGQSTSCAPAAFWSSRRSAATTSSWRISASTSGTSISSRRRRSRSNGRQCPGTTPSISPSSRS
jgi:hypothetical protein